MRSSKYTVLDKKHTDYLVNDRLLYTTCDEDSRSEIAGLEIKPTDKVICITGSGCRALSLLSQGPDKILAIDGNPLQNYLLELKVAAIRSNDRLGYLNFIGYNPSSCGHRVEIYDSIRKHLSDQARDFWDVNIIRVKASY